MKLKAIPVVRQYELTYLVPVDKTTAEQSVFAEQIIQEIKKGGGEIISQDDWGKRPLAYTIKQNKVRHTEAIYFHVVFSMDTARISDFESTLRLNQDLIRYLLVVAELVAQ